MPKIPRSQTGGKPPETRHVPSGSSCEENSEPCRATAGREGGDVIHTKVIANDRFTVALQQPDSHQKEDMSDNIFAFKIPSPDEPLPPLSEPIPSLETLPFRPRSWPGDR